jgi:hypothetical protein
MGWEFGLETDPNFADTLFIYGLFDDALSNRGYTALNGKMLWDNELERMWKEAVVASFGTLPHLPGGT